MVLRDYRSSGHHSSILRLIFRDSLVSHKLGFRHKGLVNEFMESAFRPAKMYIKSMSHFYGEKTVFLESSIWTYKYAYILLYSQTWDASWRVFSEKTIPKSIDVLILSEIEKSPKVIAK